jgi:hypothetical protein
LTLSRYQRQRQAGRLDPDPGVDHDDPDEHPAGFLGDGGFIVGAGEAADGVQVLKERQGHKLGLLTDGPSQQPRSAESRNLPQVSHDLPAIVLFIAICLVTAADCVSGDLGTARSTRDEPVNLSDSRPETHQHCSPADANCCRSLLLDPVATMGNDLHKRLFLLVSARGE